MFHRLNIDIIAAIVVLACSGSAIAQNPLRGMQQNTMQQSSSIANTPASNHSNASSPPSGQPQHADSGFQPIQSSNQSVNQIPPAVHAAMYQERTEYPVQNVGNPAPRQPERDDRTQPSPPKEMPLQNETLQQVGAANERPANTADLAPVISMLDSLQETHAVVSHIEEIPSPDARTAIRRISASAESASPAINTEPKPQQLSDAENVLSSLGTSESSDASASRFASDGGKMRLLAEKLAINTVIVMVCGVGFIFIARQWLKLKRPVTNTPEVAFEIKSKIQISPKSHLMLVNLGSERLVVATDATGVKSLIRLTDSFADTLDAMENEETEEVPADFMSALAGAAANNRDDNRSSGANLYSLATVGKSKAAPLTNTEQRDRAAGLKAPKPDSEAAREAAIRKQMEEALTKHGLKDLILQKMQLSS